MEMMDTMVIVVDNGNVHGDSDVDDGFDVQWKH